MKNILEFIVYTSRQRILGQNIFNPFVYDVTVLIHIILSDLIKFCNFFNDSEQNVFLLHYILNINGSKSPSN